MKNLVILHDKTSHGGQVITASAKMDINGIPVALVGDQVSCPIHGNNTIMEGSEYWQEGGRGVVVDRGKTACGSIIFARQQQVDTE